MIEIIKLSDIKSTDLKRNMTEKMVDMVMSEWYNDKLNKEFYREEIRDSIEINSTKFLIWIKNHELVGMICWVKVYSIMYQNIGPWIDNFIINKKYRRKGYSKILLDKMIEEIKIRNPKIEYIYAGVYAGWQYYDHINWSKTDMKLVFAGRDGYGRVYMKKII